MSNAVLFVIASVCAYLAIIMLSITFDQKARYRTRRVSQGLAALLIVASLVIVRFMA